MVPTIHPLKDKDVEVFFVRELLYWVVTYDAIWVPKPRSNACKVSGRSPEIVVIEEIP